jgi:hypothetical protein
MSSNRSALQLRRYNDRLAIKRQLSICSAYVGITVVKPGKFRKLKALNCGQPRCLSCSNPRRTWGRLTMAELRSNDAFKYGIND